MNTTTESRCGRRVRVGLLVACAVGASFLFCTPRTQAADCLSAEIATPVLFPDGRVQPPGRLTLCDWKTYSPVSQIHKTYVDGHPVSMVLGRRMHSEGGGTIPSELLFEIDSEGRLALLGYVRSSRGRSETFLFETKNYGIDVKNRLARHETLLAVVATSH